MNKRKLAYLRRYIRVGSILFLFIAPVVFFYLLKNSRQYYRNVSIQYYANSEDIICQKWFTLSPQLLLFSADENSDSLAYKIVRKLKSQLRDFGRFIPSFVKSIQQDSVLFLLRNCLLLEPTMKEFPIAVFLIDKKGVVGVYSLQKSAERKKLKEDLTIFLFLKKHPEYNAESTKKK